MSSPADRWSSKRILRTRPNWPFLWRHYPLQICHLGLKCVKAPSLLAQRRLKKITLNSKSVPDQTQRFQSNDRKLAITGTIAPFFIVKNETSRSDIMNLTQHKHGFENSKYCSNHYAVLRSGKKVTITRGPDPN